VSLGGEKIGSRMSTMVLSIAETPELLKYKVAKDLYGIS
jgi:hypothetical protein